jgi:hypothetical protein
MHLQKDVERLTSAKQDLEASAAEQAETSRQLQDANDAQGKNTHAGRGRGIRGGQCPKADGRTARKESESIGRSTGAGCEPLYTQLHHDGTTGRAVSEIQSTLCAVCSVWFQR